MALLGSGDKQASEQMYTVVGDIMRKSDTTSNIGNAILYECICCASSIHPSPKLLEAAADTIAKFLKVCLLDWSRIFDKHLFVFYFCLFIYLFTYKATSHLTFSSALQSDSHNLKYMGIDALGRLIKISPEIAEQHQLAVIDCLEVSCLKTI